VLVKENQSACVYNPPQRRRWPAIALGLGASGICCLALLKLLPGSVSVPSISSSTAPIDLQESRPSTPLSLADDELDIIMRLAGPRRLLDGQAITLSASTALV
jgi:hypothetical protein